MISVYVQRDLTTGEVPSVLADNVTTTSICLRVKYAVYSALSRDSGLYPEGERLSKSENALCIGKEIGMCENNVNALDIMTFGDAAKLLLDVLTNHAPAHRRCGYYPSVGLNRCRKELNRVPRSIQNAFERLGWEYIIGYSILEKYGEKYDKNCTGITSYGTEQLYVSSSLFMVHEFGHFLNQQLQFPELHESLFHEEAQSARSMLRE